MLVLRNCLLQGQSVMSICDRGAFLNSKKNLAVKISLLIYVISCLKIWEEKKCQWHYLHIRMNWTGLAKFSLPPIFANKILSEHKYAYQRLYVWLLLCFSVASTSDPPNLNYLLTGSLQREFPNFKLDWKEDSEFYLLISTPQKRTQMEIFRISVLFCTGVAYCERKLSLLEYWSP